MNHLDQIEDNSICVFKLGQIDVQISYYYKTLKQKIDIDIENYFNNLINIYISFLCKYKNKLNIIICGINLPNPNNFNKYLIRTIKTKNNDVIDYIKQIKIEEINNNSIKFNQLLKNKAIEHNIKYFDTTNSATEYLNNNYYLKKMYIGNDHHYLGCRDMNALKRNYNVTPINYIYHEDLSNTYKLFFKELLKVIDN